MGNAAGDRTLAWLSAVATVAGGLAFIAAVTATQGASYPGYVSEAGVAGQPYQLGYRLGIYGLGGGLVLLAGALRRAHPLVAGVLLASGLLAAVSGSVTCSAGCPLPPFQSPTPADLVHGLASVAGVGLCALAVLLLALSRTDTSLRRLARVALVPIVPVGLLNVCGIAFVGRGVLTGTAERILLLLVVGWCLATALIATARIAPADSMTRSGDPYRAGVGE